MKKEFSETRQITSWTTLSAENLSSVSQLIEWSFNIIILLKLGKDIEIALTEIRQLQNEIDKLMEEEMHKRNIIDDLTDQRNQLQG